MIRKRIHSLCSTSLLLSAIVLIACGEESETVRVTERYTLDMLGKGVSLTEEMCDSARMGQLLYVGDSSSIYYCSGKSWKRVNGKDGKDGHNGKDGADGADGKKGSYGTSGTDCFADEFADGFVLGCGATKAIVHYDFKLPDTCRIALRFDSSYVLTCGKDTAALLQGVQGDAGDICRQTDIGGGQVRIVCGQDSVTLYKAACGDVPFDPDGSQFCYGDTLVDRCNTQAYDLKKRFCYNDSLVNLCGGKTYELKDQFCYGDSLVNLCGGKDYDLAQQFCYNDSLVKLCGGKNYDIKNQFCYNDSLVNLCGGKDYDIKNQFCYGDSLVPLCGGKAYNLEEKFCYENSLMNLCDGDSYDPETQFCYNGIIADICAGLNYNPVTERCYEGVVVPKCPTELEDNQFCDERNGKVYRFTVIGGATWMAQNLDYRVPNSFCENSLRDSQRDDSLYCENEQMVEYTRRPVGRYYPWSVAMARTEDECGHGHQCPNLTYPHQGVCPEGWHVPDTTEWRALIKIMGKDNRVYWDRSVSAGKDDYGLSVIPTGIMGVSYVKETKKFTRRDLIKQSSADTWSSTERDGSCAYLYFLFADGNYGGVVNELCYSKNEYARTVRCVKD